MWDKIKEIKSLDTDVKKYVFESKNAVAESVLYKYPSYEERTVICCSTQSGCPIGCRFCGAGDAFVRSLTAEEIVSQPVYLLEQTGIDPLKIKRLQIMFMSMGEPLLNYNNLEVAIKKLNTVFPNATLLISTSAPNVPEKFAELALLSKNVDKIGLQFSVHESTNENRKKLIPFKNIMSLEEIAKTGEKWATASGRRPFFNYCVHDKNNSEEDVENLFRLFSPQIWEATISVICERDENIAAANKRQEKLAADFMQKLLIKGFSTRMFNPAGQDDIGGGCGQLWFVQEWMKNNVEKIRKSAGHGLEKVHTPKETL